MNARDGTPTLRNNGRNSRGPLMPTAGIFLPWAYSDGIENPVNGRLKRARKAFEVTPDPWPPIRARASSARAGFPVASGDS
jgi:hypothetical protein